MRHGDTAALHIGDPAVDPADEPSARYERCFGARIEEGRRVWVPDARRAVSWLRDGAEPNASTGIWRAYELAALGVAGAWTTLDGWALAVDRLTWGAEASSSDFLAHVVGDGSTAMVTEDDGSTVSARFRSILAPPTVRQSRPAIKPRSSLAATSPLIDLSSWAARLGSVSPTDESAKVDRRGVAIGRPLLIVDTASNDRTCEGDLVEAFTEIGMDVDSASDAAAVATAVGGFYIGEQRHGNVGLRRKIYVRGFSDDSWQDLSRHWPDRLTSSGPTPSWVAWKMAADRPGQVERAIEVDALGGASTIGHALEPVIGRLRRQWIDLVRQVLSRFGVSEADEPHPGDSITLEESGRYSVDIFTWVRDPDRGPSTLEGELRSRVVAAGHGYEAADDLVAWAGARRLANFIVGLDKAGEPFVNLYARGLPLRGWAAAVPTDG